MQDLPTEEKGGSALPIGNWATPVYKAEKYRLSGNTQQSLSLEPQARNWPIPTTQEIAHTDIEMTHTGRRKTKDGKNSHSLNLEDTTRINSQNTHQDPQTHPDGSTCSVSCRRLNPLFVEYLMMGKWLIGWTDLKPLGTQLLGRQELSHSDSVSKGQEF